MNGQTFIFADPDGVAEESARRLVRLMAESTGERFSLALSGGSTPQRFYRLLTTPHWRGQIDWGRLHIFLADERFLPLDHPDSNFRMLSETLIDPVNSSTALKSPLTPLSQRGGQEKLPKSNIHPMPTDGTVEECAVRYETELKKFFGNHAPRFDLIVLGMGPDGHTASLFPGHIHPLGTWVLPVHHSPKPPPTRLSLSLDVINQAHQVLFLVTGQDKAAALATLRKDSLPTLPARTVQLNEGELVWLVDEAAWEET